MKAGKVKLAFAFSVFFVLAVSAASLCFGSVDIPPNAVFSAIFGGGESGESLIVTQLRLPRIAAALITGASLALAGCGLQSVFINPLAEPSITGVSAGASLGAVIAIMFFPSAAALQILAFAFALAASLCVCAVAREGGKINPTSAVLAGVAVNAMCAAGVGLFMYSTREIGIKSFVFWSLGSFDKCDWSDIRTCFLVSFPAWIVMLGQYKRLNVMLLGHRQAFDIGVNVRATQYLVVLAAVAMTSASVAMCGVIGFVGLIIPHIARAICGADNGKVMPLSMIAGAALAVCADLFARVASPDYPVPVGVITSILGAPFFVLILKQKRRNA